MRTRLCIQPSARAAACRHRRSDSRSGRAARRAAARRPARQGKPAKRSRSGVPAAPAGARAGGGRIPATAISDRNGQACASSPGCACRTACQTWRGETSPQCRCGERPEVPSVPGVVALRRIAGDRPGDEAGEPGLRAGLARRPERREIRPPSRARRRAGRAEAVQRIAGRRRGDRAQPRRRQEREIGLAHRRHRLGEGRVDRIGLAAAAHHPGRLPQHRGGGQAQPAARGLQRLRHAAVALARPGLVQPPGQHLGRADRLGQRGDDDLGAAAHQQQRRPARGEVPAPARPATALQPPAARRRPAPSARPPHRPARRPAAPAGRPRPAARDCRQGAGPGGTRARRGCPCPCI